MTGSRQEIHKLAVSEDCPRCHHEKTLGTGLCHRCRSQLPANMRRELVAIETQEVGKVVRAMRAAANYFHLHFQSIRNFGGGRRK
ncbi:MAG: hypothetical protein WBX15_18780 [Thermoanaerobaculia bacterium]